MTPRVVGLDLSLTATGIAHDGGQRTIRSNKTGIDRCVHIAGQVMDDISAWLSNLHDLIVIEGYSFGAPRSSHSHALGELGGIIRFELRRMGRSWVDVPPASLKKYATGKGNANKGEMLAAAIRRLDYEGASDNEADALWLRAMGLDHLGAPLVDLPAINRTALEKVQWP